MAQHSRFYPRAIPLAALGAAILTLLLAPSLPASAAMLLAAVQFAALVPVVFVSVLHADVIAHRTGEPYGTLVLTAAVTVIEVALILSIMLAGDGSPTLARDTVLAVLMVVCNGLVGLCLIVGGFRYGEQGFRVSGVIAYLIVLMPLATLTLILPGFTISTPGPFYTTTQLIYISLATLVLYAVFLYVQTVRHSDYFLSDIAADTPAPSHVSPSPRDVWESVGLLIVALVAVVLLAKGLGQPIKAIVRAVDAPIGAVGLLVAIIVLMPESISALRSARRNELQKSLNLALGSSLATIGMTIPAVGALSMLLGTPIALGLEQRDIVLVTLTFAISIATFASGRTNILPGFVHLILFATFVFLIFAP